MAARASAVLALVGLGVAVAAFAAIDALAGTWACGSAGCPGASTGPEVFALAVVGGGALVLAGIAAGRWLRAITPRREWDARRRR